MKKLIFTFCFLSFVFMQTSCTQGPQRQISVRGNCLKSVKPNRGSVVFYAESLQDSAQAALSQATKIYETAREAVQKMDLKDLELSSLENSVRKEKQWQDGTNVFKGYKARIGLKVYTSEIDRLGKMIAVVSSKGIRNIGSLQMDLSPAKIKQEKEDCLAVAIANAKSKAVKMAQMAGSHIGEVLSIQEGNSQAPVPGPPRALLAEAKSRSQRVSIDAKNQDISMNVEVVFALD